MVKLNRNDPVELNVKRGVSSVRQMTLFTLGSNLMTDSLAYIDAGAGSMLIQAVVAGALTGAYFLKTQWKALKQVVGGFVSKSKRSGQ